MTTHYDVIIIGAGAAGLMCAITAGQRGRRVLVLDHAKKAVCVKKYCNSITFFDYNMGISHK